MSLDIKCKLVRKLPVQNGKSSRGEWSKREFVVETFEKFPRKICMSVWGEDKVKELDGYGEGDALSVSVNIESREFNGRWYTDVRAWRLQKENENGRSESKGDISMSDNDPFAGVAETDGGEDLPF